MEVDICVVNVSCSGEEALGEALGAEAGDHKKVVLFHCGCVLGGEREGREFDGPVKVRAEEMVELLLLLGHDRLVVKHVELIDGLVAG